MARVMLVDDEYDAVFACRFILESYNYQVDGFTEPNLALQAYSDGLYDLILLDVRMPSMDGFELYRILKGKDEGANICFITAGQIEYLEPHLFGSSIFLRKPFSNSELIGYTDRMIKHSPIIK